MAVPRHRCGSGHRTEPPTMEGYAGVRRAVVDIGSNSIRLVVFGGPARVPVAVFNEKVLSGLGSTLHDNDRLDPAGAALALTNLERFATLLKIMAVEQVDVVATAAVRDARDGESFVRDLYRRTGLDARILTGAEEAALSALGVIAGIPKVDGIMGDLGGGSLELAQIAAGKTTERTTLPLGPLRLQTPVIKAKAQIDAAFAGLDWLKTARDGMLYLVGGSWRALARIHMAQTDYPLRLVHRYRLRRHDMLSLTDLVARQSPESLRRLPGVPPRRRGVLPHASLLLNRLLRHIQPHSVEFCAYGLREGLLYADLPPEVQSEDSLLAACGDINAQASRFPGLAPALHRWTANLVDGEGKHGTLLREAAGLLSDIAWRAHPDHRANDVFRQVFTHPGLLVEHRDRAFLALAVYHRYTGKEMPQVLDQLHGLIRGEEVQRARILGLAFRLGETISGGDPTTLDRFALLRRKDEGRLCLRHTAADRALLGEVVVKRLNGLATTMALRPAIEEGHGPGSE